MRCLALVAVVATLAVSVNAAPQWNIVAKDLITEDAGVSFVDANTGYTVGAGNGVGPEILKSVDGGHTWKPCNASFGIDILPLSVAAAQQTVVLSSIFGEMYSDDDGNTFHFSVGGGLSQSCRYFGTNGDGGHKFGVAGTYGGQQGVAVSVDGGKLFKKYTTPKLYTLGRYGAYPTDTTWYVTAGTWPQTPQSDDDMASDDDFAPPQSARRMQRTAWQDEKNRFKYNFKGNSDGNLKDGMYQAQLAKTTDGGQTWTVLFSQNNTFYFNGIDCSPTNPNHCCAVGEGMADSPVPGVRIYCTEDGQNFNRTFYQAATTKEGYSLMDIRFASDNTIWAAGTIENAVAPSAWFLQSTDGGKTWDPQTHTIFGYVTLALDVVSEKVAYAAVDNPITQSSGIAKYLDISLSTSN